MSRLRLRSLIGDATPTPKGRVKHHFLLKVLESPINLSNAEFANTCCAHADLVDPNHKLRLGLPAVVRHKGIIYATDEVHNAATAIEVHPSIVPRFETWIKHRNTLILNINIIINYATAVMHRSVTLNDAYALLPSFLHELMEFEVSMYYSEWMYKCRKQDQTLTDAQVAEFNELHKDAFKILRVMHLSKLTQ